MRHLKVALIVKGSPATLQRGARNMGFWSYPVAEFEWQHFHLGDGFHCPRSKFKDFDVIFVEDAGNWGDFIGEGPRVVYHVIDSTLTEAHYQCRLRQARQSDIVLLEHDTERRFVECGRPLYRWNYCVNDTIFKPVAKKLVDVSFHNSGAGRWHSPGGPERADLRTRLDEICKRRGWSYRSGALGLQEYAQSMAESRIVVNLPRTGINRPHRVFDTMACRSLLLTAPIPTVPRDDIVAGVHCGIFDPVEEIEAALAWWLGDDALLQDATEAGYRLVMERHTWRTRAKELRVLLGGALGI